jgi:hypothetical protein
MTEQTTQNKEQKEELQYTSRVISMICLPQKESIFSELGTTITIVDEAAGEFLEVTQSTDMGLMVIRITKKEWPHLRSTINTMMDNVK